MVTYLHEFYKDFVDKYNIINGQLTSQYKLNRSVNVLKKETDDCYNRLELFRGQYALAWNDFTEYKEGQIVSFTTDPGLPSEVTKNYSVITGMTNTNKIPDVEPTYWEEVTIDDYLQSINSVILSQYLNINNTNVYNPTGDYNPATKKYVDDRTKVFYIGSNPANGFNFLSLDNTSAYTPTMDYHPATKKYFDDALSLSLSGNIHVSAADDSLALGGRDATQYITVYRDFVGSYNGMAVKNGSNPNDLNATDWIRTPANGLIPYDQNKGSELGSDEWQFRAVHAVDFYGNYHYNSTGIAEKYESDADYDEGTVLQIGTTSEVTKYDNGILAGVVTANSGIVMNQDINAIHSVQIALKGRIKVKITGTAARGQYINADTDGKGIPSNTKTDKTIGVCVAGGANMVEVKI